MRKILQNIIDIESADVVVAGGGIAGICSAIASAREGAKTILIDRYGFLGGMSTAGMVSPFMKYWIVDEFDNKVKPLVGGVFEEIVRGMERIGGVIDNGFSAWAFRKVVNELLHSVGVKSIRHAIIYGVEFENVGKKRKITALILAHNSRFYRVSGKVFVDTTGDAEIVYLANAGWVKGDEETGFTQAMTLFFRVGGIDVKKVVEFVRNNPDQFYPWSTSTYIPGQIVSIAGYFDIVKQGKENGLLPESIEYIFFTTLPEDGEASFNTTNILGLDGTRSFDLTKAEVEGRLQMWKIFNFLKQKIQGFENSYLLESGIQVGVRETRRAIGEYIITGEDILKARKFSDAIARACYGIDIHGQRGERSRLEHLKEGQYYEVPLRALIVKKALNLLVAGKCISSTREGHSALRIQATSAATGEAAGVVAALALNFKGDVRNVPYEIIKQKLKARGNI
ncbi:MAG: FAD-dependent oxidoreductase [Candidatus Kryptonium sp.]